METAASDIAVVRRGDRVDFQPYCFGPCTIPTYGDLYHRREPPGTNR